MSNRLLPFQVSLDLTTGCNLRCKHCYYSSAQLSRHSFLGDEALFNLVSYLGVNGVFHLSIAGGEPLLYPRIDELIEHAHQNKLTTTISTNAILLTKEMAVRLKKNGLKFVQVSLDGSNSEVNDSIRGKGSFDKALLGIRNAVDAGLNVVLAYVITKRNLDDALNVFEFAEKLGCYGVKIQTFIGDRGLGMVNRNTIEPSESETINLLNKLWYDKRRFDGKLNVIIPMTPDVAKIIEGKSNGDLGCLGCQPGLKSISINQAGEVKACSTQVEDGEGVIGNVLENDLKYIYSKNLERITRLKQQQVQSGVESSSCGSLCGKGCRSVKSESLISIA